MMMFSELLKSLQDLGARISGDEDVDASESDELMARIREAVPTMVPDQVQALHDEMGKLISLVTERKGSIDGELTKIQKSRKALNGYDHLVDNHTSQRLYRRV